jgi:hypothetical protein
MLLFIEDRVVLQCICILNSEDAMSPSDLNEPISLSIELVLSLDGIELFKLRLDILKLLSSLVWRLEKT